MTVAEPAPPAIAIDAVPAEALQFGFATRPSGALASRTLMLAELRQLLTACPSNATFGAYRAAILDDNVLAKTTQSTRRETLKRLRELYGLDAAVPLFRTLRELWPADPPAQPLLACLCASAREPVLGGTAAAVLPLQPGAVVTPESLAASAAVAFPGHYGPMSLASIGRNAASAWQQSGHLRGRTNKTRAQALCRPVAASYALLLGWLCGARGDYLFETFWARLLDAPAHHVREQAVEASRMGWIDYRQAGGVVEISFKHLLRHHHEDAP